MTNKTDNNKYDELSAMMAWEQGDLDKDGTIDLFQHLVDSGLAWQLQGVYGRTAAQLINRGYVKDTHGVLQHRSPHA